MMAKVDAGKPLKGVHSVVTGASRGIGLAIVGALARFGASVTLMARDRGGLLEASASLCKRFPGQSFLDVVVDVTSGESITEGFGEARGVLGPPAILVNNAGGADGTPFGALEPDDWHRAIALNLTSVFLCCREVVPGMVEVGGGRIVNVASTAGLRGYPYVTAYSAAKHGVLGLTRSLAIETESTGVTVNAVCPGFVDTPMTQASARKTAEKTGTSVADVLAQYAKMNESGRLIPPDEVAEKVAWLCRPELRSVSGDAIVIE